jgi:hypothetical protein
MEGEVSSVFLPIIGGDQVEEAIKDTLKYWMNTYIRQVEFQRGEDADAIPLPRSYEITTDVDDFPESQLPAVVIISPGLDGEPFKTGDGNYRAMWAVGVAVICSGNDRASTNKLSKIYGSVVRAILLQKNSLRGFAADTEWLDESYDDVPADAGRTLAAAQIIFRVSVDDVVNQYGGPGMSVPDEDIEPDEGDPDDADAQPGSDWEQFQTASVDVQREED